MYALRYRKGLVSTGCLSVLGLAAERQHWHDCYPLAQLSSSVEIASVAVVVVVNKDPSASLHKQW